MTVVPLQWGMFLAAAWPKHAPPEVASSTQTSKSLFFCSSSAVLLSLALLSQQSAIVSISSATSLMASYLKTYPLKTFLANLAAALTSLALPLRLSSCLKGILDGLSWMRPATLCTNEFLILDCCSPSQLVSLRSPLASSRKVAPAQSLPVESFLVALRPPFRLPSTVSFRVSTSPKLSTLSGSTPTTPASSCLATAFHSRCKELNISVASSNSLVDKSGDHPSTPALSRSWFSKSRAFTISCCHLGGLGNGPNTLVQGTFCGTMARMHFPAASGHHSA